MSLYRVTGIWYIDLPSERGRIRRSTGTADKKEAQQYHERVKGEIWRQDKLGEAPPITWGEAVKKWLDVKPRGMPDRYRLRSIGLAASDLLPLSSSTLEQKLAKYQGSTHNRVLALLLAIHSCASVPMPKIEKKEVPKGRTRWLSAEEWKTLRSKLAITSPLLAQAAEFTLSTGLRENNVLGLEWSQVDMKRRVAWIYADQAKGKETIGVPLNDDAMAVLEARRGIHKRFVFGNPDYVLYKASNRAWYEALRQAKLVGFRWHDLRHTWASWAVQGGVRIEELQQLGGWKTLQMVQRYSHLSTEHLAGVAAKVKPVSVSYNTPRKQQK